MSEALDAAFASVKDRVDRLRKRDRLPYWRLAYAEFSLRRIGEYLTLGESDEALEMISRLDRWISSHEKELDRSEPAKVSRIPLWNVETLQREIAGFEEKLSGKKYLIPVAERIAFSGSLEKAHRLISEGSCDEAYSELFSLRTRLVSRLRRSYRARRAMMLYSSHKGAFGRSVTGTVVGPYNAERTLENALSLVGERDAIWVEDFLELYDGISKITERLSPVERKRK